MRPTHHSKLRALLLKHPDGLGIATIADHLGLPEPAVRASLRSMPDAYIDRWFKARNRKWAAIWCVVEVPEDCPMPEYKHD
jgi:hypothetical protein